LTIKPLTYARGFQQNTIASLSNTNIYKFPVLTDVNYTASKIAVTLIDKDWLKD